MVRVSNGIITVLNAVTLALALAAIGWSISFHVQPETVCQRAVRTPLLVAGVALAVVSVAGLVGSCFRVSFLLWIYQLSVFLLIFGLFAFTIFTVMVTRKGIGKDFSEREIVGHLRLGDYSHWLQNHVRNAKNWAEIKSCMADVKLCHTAVKAGKGEDYYKHKLPPILSGCCKPPSYCGLQFQNATYWTMPKTGPLVPDLDCMTWSNSQKQMCFDCQSCKAAIIDDIKREWRLLALINFCIVIFVTIIHSIGSCAMRKNREDRYKKRAAYP